MVTRLQTKLIKGGFLRTGSYEVGLQVVKVDIEESLQHKQDYKCNGPSGPSPCVGTKRQKKTKL